MLVRSLKSVMVHSSYVGKIARSRQGNGVRHMGAILSSFGFGLFAGALASKSSMSTTEFLIDRYG